MPCYFTHYWKNKTWEYERNRDPAYDRVGHTASNKFRKVNRGDSIYIVTVQGGDLYLGGRMEVGKILDKADAEDELDDTDLWDATYHAIAKEGSDTEMDFARIVPPKTVHKLRFIAGGKFVPPVLKNGKLDTQTMRGVRELTPESAGLLEELLIDNAPD